MPKQLFLRFSLTTLICINSNQVFALEQSKSLTPTESLLPMLIGLLSILAVIFALAYVFKKFSTFGLASKNIKVIESQVIGNKEKLLIVQVQQQQFLIGVTGHTISQLGELDKLVDKNGIVSSDIESENETCQQRETSSVFGNIINQLIKAPNKITDEKNTSSKNREMA